MPKYLIRQTCDYSVLIEADNVEDAILEATEIDLGEWATTWSDLEAERQRDSVGQRCKHGRNNCNTCGY